MRPATEKCLVLTMALLLVLMPMPGMADSTGTMPDTVVSAKAGDDTWQPLAPSYRPTGMTGCNEHMRDGGRCSGCSAPHCGPCLLSLPCSLPDRADRPADRAPVFHASLHSLDTRSPLYRPPRA